jgi:preprotein translocase subunit SecE
MGERQVAMNVRKGESSEATKSKRIAAMQGLAELKAEFKRISWTSKEELRAYTKIVVGATFIVGLGIYVVDLVVRGTLDGVGVLVKAVVG